jgi:hypothetical protein
MIKANEKFLILEKKLTEQRDSGDKLLNEQEDDDVCQEMGDLWWAMSDEERDSADIRAKEWNSGFDNKKLEENSKKILDGLVGK